MKVPFYSFSHIHSDEIKSEIIKSFEKILNKGNFIQGDEVREFESHFAQFSHALHGVGVSNGLDALRMSLKAMGVEAGDEVIVPSNTYIATWLAVTDIGAIVVPVEPRLDSYNINPELIKNKITSKTKVIIPVHLYGQACEMDAIMDIARKHNLQVLEDNAQSQGATVNGKHTGGIGDMAATSLYPGKNLGGLGDAGVVTTNSAELADNVKTIANYGSKVKYHHDVLGTNCRLDTVQAAALTIKLRQLPALNNMRVDMAHYYDRTLEGVGDLVLPKLAEGTSSVYHQYVIRTSNRDELQKHLMQAGVGTLMHYPVPPHLQPCYTHLFYKKGDFPIAEEIADTCLSLPIWPGMSDDQLQHVAQSIKSFF